MSTPKPLTEQEQEFIEKLSEHFVLIPKNRWWHFLGGATAFAIAAFALSFAGVLAGMKSSSAVKASDRIEQIRNEAEAHLKNLRADTYIKYGDSIALESPHHKTYVFGSLTEGVRLQPPAGRNYAPDTRFIPWPNPENK